MVSRIRCGFPPRRCCHNVEPAERAHRLVDQHIEVGELAHVGVDADRLLTELADLLLERLCRSRMSHIVDDEIGTLPGEFENNRLADPAVAAGDDGDLAL